MFNDSALSEIAEKISCGVRLDFNDGVALYSTNDITGLGILANRVKQKKNGDLATFVVNRHINPTNICIKSCQFCDFARKPNDKDAYAMQMEEVIGFCSPGIKEIHITGALNPMWTFKDYMDIVRAIRKHAPAVVIKAYTAVEVAFFSEIEGISVEDVLKQMINSGVDCLPGGGAEIFSERVRDLLFSEKIGANRWLQIHKKAHNLGLRSNATMLYGHIETVEERVNHLIRLRSLQDETNGFLCFVPLAYQPVKAKNGMTLPDRQPSAIEDIKNVAVPRLMLDNFEHIKAYWVTLGEDIASLALNFGADDIDGTIGEERIMHAAGAASPVNLMRDKLINLIKQAGLEPIERDGLYNCVTVKEELDSRLGLPPKVVIGGRSGMTNLNSSTVTP